MGRPASIPAPPRRRKRSRRDVVWTGLGAGFLAWALFSQTGLSVADVIASVLSYEHLMSDALIVAGVVLAVAGAQACKLDRYIWHMAANAFVFEKARTLSKVWVIDGDTIDGDGVRYRLANVDAPETGENAKCFRENKRGEEATQTAIQLVRKAANVSVRRTWRTDIYGRRIAFVLIDGVDLGKTLVRLGLARPWCGKRERWCGPNGGLAKIARSGARPHACTSCQAWR